MAGHTVVADTFVDATATADAYLDVVLYDSAFAVDDLEADEYVSLTIQFKRTGLT
jgi:hypothetical protein